MTDTPVTRPLASRVEALPCAICGMKPRRNGERYACNDSTCWVGQTHIWFELADWNRRAAVPLPAGPSDEDKAEWFRKGWMAGAESPAPLPAGEPVALYRNLCDDVMRCIPADWKPNYGRNWGAHLGNILAEYIDDLRAAPVSTGEPVAWAVKQGDSLTALHIFGTKVGAEHYVCTFFDAPEIVPLYAAPASVAPRREEVEGAMFVLYNARRDCEFAYRDADGENFDPGVLSARANFKHALDTLLALYGPAPETAGEDK